MAKFMSTQKVISFRNYDRLDGDTYIVQEFAWPVIVLECQANKVADRKLDILEEAVLELLKIPEISLKKIAEYLNIGDEVVSAIVGKSFVQKNLYDLQNHCLTNTGEEYLEKKDTGVFTEEKVFGNVFVSQIDGEVFPYFFEGKLPWGRFQPDMKYLSFDDENPQDFLADRNALAERVNRAFHQYGRIYRNSDILSDESEEKNVVQFIEEELIEEDFDEREPETLADVEASHNLQNARIKLLKTKPQEAYILFRVAVSKAAPEKFIVESPFSMNITRWYVDCFNRMRRNNETIYVNSEDIKLLDGFCQEMTDQFYVKFPELRNENPEQAIRIQYPLMSTCSISRALLKQYKEVMNYKTLCANHSIRPRTVITEEAISLELFLNNYIQRTNIARTLDKYSQTIAYLPDLMDIFKDFGIENCTALYNEKNKTNHYGEINHKNSILTENNFSSGKMGKSCMEKYLYLIVDAYFDDRSKFRRLLVDAGQEFVEKIDFINTKRNKHGAHNNGTVPIEISDEDYATYQKYFSDVTNMLLRYFD